MNSEILALLAERPKSVKQLMVLLDATSQEVQKALYELTIAEGVEWFTDDEGEVFFTC